MGPIHGQGRTAGRAGRPGRRIASGPTHGAGARGAAMAFIRSGCGDVGGGGELECGGPQKPAARPETTRNDAVFLAMAVLPRARASPSGAAAGRDGGALPFNAPH